MLVLWTKLAVRHYVLAGPECRVGLSNAAVKSLVSVLNVHKPGKEKGLGEDTTKRNSLFTQQCIGRYRPHRDYFHQRRRPQRPQCRSRWGVESTGPKR